MPRSRAIQPWSTCPRCNATKAWGCSRPISESQKTDPPSGISDLGPDGSFSHLLTMRRFPGTPTKLLANVGKIFNFLQSQPGALGIVPIENSSGGFIIDTVDRLVDERCTLHIIEELTLDVKLALLGHAGERIDFIYSHPMPFFHSDEWLRENHSDAKGVRNPSTAAAAKTAADPHATAHNLIIRSVDGGVCSNRLISLLLHEWREQRHDALNGWNVWSLFNAFTESLKDGKLAELPKRTKALHGLLDTHVGLSA